MSHTANEDNVPPSPAGHGEGISHTEPDSIGVAGLSVLFALVAVVIVLIVVLLQAWFYNWKVDLLAQRLGPIDEQQTPAAIAKLQREQIERYGWADPATKSRAIPITQAMEIIVNEYSGQPAGSEETSAK
jgi:hypothetical protein